jgi:hypothetical protein
MAAATEEDPPWKEFRTSTEQHLSRIFFLLPAQKQGM